MEFATLNDVGLEFFLREIIVHLKRDQKVIGECVAELAHVPAARALAEEVYGNLRGHIELLEGVAADCRSFCRKGPTAGILKTIDYPQLCTIVRSGRRTYP